MYFIKNWKLYSRLVLSLMLFAYTANLFATQITAQSIISGSRPELVMPVTLDADNTIEGLQFDVQYDATKISISMPELLPWPGDDARQKYLFSQIAPGVGRVHLIANRMTEDPGISLNTQRHVINLRIRINNPSPGFATPVNLYNARAVSFTSTGTPISRFINISSQGGVILFSPPATENDTDGDGMSNDYENANGLDPNNPLDAVLDSDGDGLLNYLEHQLGTSANNSDTDGDGLPDGFEVANHLSSLDSTDALADLDHDGISNLIEYQQGSSIRIANAYNIIEIGAVSDGGIDLHTYPKGIDESNNVAGYACTYCGQSVKGYVWNSNDGLTVLNGTFAGVSSYRLMLSDIANGFYVGTSGSSNYNSNAFVWAGTGNTATSLASAWSTANVANKVNEAGNVVGRRNTSSSTYTGAMWKYDGITYVETLLGDLGNGNTIAYSLNNNDIVVGESKNIDNIREAFIWSAQNGMQGLGMLGGNSSQANDINDDDEVVGVVNVNNDATGSNESHAFIWSANDGMQDLNWLDNSYSVASAINNLGQMVGQARNSSNKNVAVVAAGNDAVDINKLIAQSTDILLSNATDINSSGNLIASGFRLVDGAVSSKQLAYFLTPAHIDVTATPGLNYSSQLFTDTLSVHVNGVNANTLITYTLDGSVPVPGSNGTELLEPNHQIMLAESATLCVVALESGKFASAKVCADFQRLSDLDDTDADGLPDLWELHHFGDLTTSDGSQDTDGDGIADADEYQNGSDPLSNNNPQVEAFLQDAGGLTVFESEHHDGLHVVGTVDVDPNWVSVQKSWYSNGDSRRALPNAGRVFDPTIDDTPRMDYVVYFYEAGPHRVWGLGSGWADAEIIYIGLNGEVLGNLRFINGAGYKWFGADNVGSDVVIDVPAAGTYTFNVWIGEDAVFTDKFLISSDTTYTPVSTAILESSRGIVTPGGTQPTNVAPVISLINDLSVTLGEIAAFNVTASDDDGDVPVLSIPDLPIGASFLDNLDGTAAFSWLTSQVGDSSVTVVATDGVDVSVQSSQTVNISVHDSPVTPVPGFIQDSNGQVVFESEHHDYLYTVGTIDVDPNWVSVQKSWYSNGDSRRALPNVGRVFDPTVDDTPRMDFTVHFNQAGPHYVWGLGSGWADAELVYVGLEGEVQDTLKFLTGKGFKWFGTGSDGSNVIINVPAAGTYEFNVWIGEDAVFTDKLLISSDPNFVPVNTAIPESQYGTNP